MSGVVAVIDYGMGNLHSVASALRHVGAEKVIVTRNRNEICNADRIVFPGVGAIRDCMAAIQHLEFDHYLNEVIFDLKLPVLAICVGMQALMTRSEENAGIDCLNILAGQVKRFPVTSSVAGDTQTFKVPHMGWNQVVQCAQHPLWNGIPNEARFYFVHSYWVEAENRSQVVGRAEYGLSFDAAIANKNLFAVQFHPEKSHLMGLRLLKNFLNWNGR